VIVEWKILFDDDDDDDDDMDDICSLPVEHTEPDYYSDGSLKQSAGRRASFWIHVLIQSAGRRAFFWIHVLIQSARRRAYSETL
jgi:hypothetical protein